jgi:hypothetical protein
MHPHGTFRPLPAKNQQPSTDPRLRIAERFEPAMQQGVLAAFHQLRAALAPALVVPAAQRGRLGTVLGPALQAFDRSLKTAFYPAQQAHAHGYALQLVAKASLSFDLGSGSPSGIAALDGYQYDQIREISQDQRDRLSDIVGQGVGQGWSVDKIGQRLRDVVGLTESQAAAVGNFRDLLETRSPEALDRRLRDRRFDPTVQASIDNNRTLDDDQIDRMVDQYSGRYQALRARTIARFETLRASNGGSAAAIQDQIDAGDFTADQVTTFWLLTDDERTCPICRSIVDQQPDGVPFGQTFKWAYATKRKSYSGEIDVAPAHPACRCTNTFQIAGGGSAGDTTDGADDTAPDEGEDA